MSTKKTKKKTKKTANKAKGVKRMKFEKEAVTALIIGVGLGAILYVVGGAGEAIGIAGASASVFGAAGMALGIALAFVE